MKKTMAKRTPRNACTRQLMAEALELRQMCSGTLLTYGAPPPSSFSAIQVAMGATNLAVDPHGNVWFTAGNSLEAPSDSGVTHHVVPAASNGSLRNIVSNVVFTQDDSAWFVVAENGGNRLERMTADGTFQDMSAVTSASMAHLTVSQSAVWYIASNSAIGYYRADGAKGLFSVPGTTLAALTTGPDGNVWFAGANASGHGLVGKVTPAGTVTKFTLTGGAVSSLAASAGYLYAGGQNSIWQVTTAGNVSEMLHGSFSVQSLTGAPDGALWFIDAAHPARAISRVSGNSLTQLTSGIQDATTVTSLAITGGNLWFTAAGSSTGWLGKFQISSSADLLGGALSAVQNLFDSAGVVQLNGSTCYSLSDYTSASNHVALTFGTSIVSRFASEATNAVQFADTNSSTVNSNTNNNQASTGTVTNGQAAPASPVLHSRPHQEVVTGAAANDAGNVGIVGISNADTKLANTEALQDPATFEGEFRARTPENYTLPPRNISHTYYSSAVRSSRGLDLAAGHSGVVPAASFIAEPLAQLQSAATPTPRGQIITTPAFKTRAVTTWDAAQAVLAEIPVSSHADWWQLAACVSAVSGLQDCVPTKKRFTV
jgi:hypothetical protein